MKRTITLAAAALATMLFIETAIGHHSFSAEFDEKQPVTLRGTVTKAEWINPHAWVYIDVKEANGKTVAWGIELGAPNALLRRGLNKNSLPIGTQVVVEGYRAKNGSAIAHARDILLPDGRKLFAGSSGTGAPGPGVRNPQ